MLVLVIELVMRWFDLIIVEVVVENILFDLLENRMWDWVCVGLILVIRFGVDEMLKFWYWYKFRWIRLGWRVVSRWFFWMGVKLLGCLGILIDDIWWFLDVSLFKLLILRIFCLWVVVMKVRLVFGVIVILFVKWILFIIFVIEVSWLLLFCGCWMRSMFFVCMFCICFSVFDRFL